MRALRGKVVQGFCDALRARLGAPPILLREAQETRSLCSRRSFGTRGSIFPRGTTSGSALPRAARLPGIGQTALSRRVGHSSRLGEERSIAFDGEETGGNGFGDPCGEEDGRGAIADAAWVIATVERDRGPNGSGS